MSDHTGYVLGQTTAAARRLSTGESEC